MKIELGCAELEDVGTGQRGSRASKFKDLCEELNKTKTTFPGPKLRLRFAVRAPN